MKRELDDWITGYVTYMKEAEPPLMFSFWTAISCVAAALQRKCSLEMGMLTFYPNMYIVLIGPSGCRKGTAMEPGRELLESIGIKLSSQAITRQQLIRAMREAVTTEIDQRTGEMFFHCSLTVFSKEFTVFLGYQEKELMANLCDWYDCDKKWTYETVGRGREEITGLWLNIIGATTPKLIQSSMPLDAIGGGLTSRMILVYEESKEKFSPFVRKDERLFEKLRNDLEKINLLKGKFQVTEDFMEHWVEWYSEQENNPPNFYDERFEGYISRRPSHVLKLSMIMSASRSDEMVITRNDLERAISTLLAAEVKMPKAFSGVGKSKFADLIEPVLALIASKKQTNLTELMRVFYHDADVWTMERILDVLEVRKCIKRAGRMITYLEENDNGS